MSVVMVKPPSVVEIVVLVHGETRGDTGSGWSLSCYEILYEFAFFVGCECIKKSMCFI